MVKSIINSSNIGLEEASELEEAVVSTSTLSQVQ
jgi:hypothetical protein